MIGLGAGKLGEGDWMVVGDFLDYWTSSDEQQTLVCKRR